MSHVGWVSVVEEVLELLGYMCGVKVTGGSMRVVREL